MTTAAQPEDWRRKYFDSIRAIEHEGQQFRDLERVLRRLVGRLCVAAQGQSPLLDGELRRLSEAVRGNGNAQLLDDLGQRLVTAVNESDQLTASQVLPGNATTIVAPAEAVAGHEGVRAALTSMLQGLHRDPRLAPQVEDIEQRMAESLASEQLPVVLAELAELVAQRVRNIEQDKQELEGLLSHMLRRLDDMGGYLEVHSADQTQQLENSATLNTQLAGEMRAMGESMESAGDIVQIRSQLRARLDSIGRHLHAYRERERERAVGARERSEQMRQRVEQLEHEARRLHDQLQDEQRQSLLDGLTQVPNRQAFEARFEDELRRFQRFGQPVCLALCDIDHFKNVNDSFGHRAGDKVLKVVAESLAGGVRATDFLARFGGEEFALILPGTRLADAVAVMETLREGVSRLGFHFRGAPVSVTISCGITQLLEGDSSVDAFDRADKALYAGKDSGRNRCVGT